MYCMQNAGAKIVQRFHVQQTISLLFLYWYLLNNSRANIHTKYCKLIGKRYKEFQQKSKDCVRCYVRIQ